MDHVVYTDFKDNELSKLLEGTKSTILRGATGRKMPYGRLNIGDTLYFINNNGEGLVKAKGTVRSVLNSEKLDKAESLKLLEDNKDKLNLGTKLFNKYNGKRYLVLIEVGNVKEVSPFEIDKSKYSNMDDWLPVESIDRVKY